MCHLEDFDHVLRAPAYYDSGNGMAYALLLHGWIDAFGVSNVAIRMPSVLFGVGLPDENAHAPNEKLDLGNFHNGIIASAYLYEEIAALDGRLDNAAELHRECLTAGTVPASESRQNSSSHSSITRSRSSDVIILPMEGSMRIGSVSG